jgi:folate-binding protein YgfZ
MELTTLGTYGEQLGAKRVSEYRGATTPACFSDPQQEFAALRASCGVYDLGYRTKTSIAGRDRVRWLNGMVTNNIRDLVAGHGVYAFLLNPQGHILGDLYAYNRGESFMVDTDASQAEKILATFNRYIIMDDVHLTNVSEQITALGLAGPKSRAMLKATGMEVPELQPLQLHTVQCDCECGCLTCTIVRSDDPLLESYEVWTESAQVKPIWNALVKAGATPVGWEALELHRVVSGIPRYGIDIHERDLPQETEQARALNFSKGCYIGQEIVERIRSRGAVHRKFTGFLIDGTASVPLGSKISTAEKEVGEITSSAVVLAGGAEKTVALGYIRREAGVTGREVTIASWKARVVPLPIGDESLARKSPALEQRPA